MVRKDLFYVSCSLLDIVTAFAYLIQIGTSGNEMTFTSI